MAEPTTNSPVQGRSFEAMLNETPNYPDPGTDKDADQVAQDRTWLFNNEPLCANVHKKIEQVITNKELTRYALTKIVDASFADAQDTISSTKASSVLYRDLQGCSNSEPDCPTSSEHEDVWSWHEQDPFDPDLSQTNSVQRHCSPYHG